MSFAHKFKASNGKTVTMSDRPFAAILPKHAKIGDEVILKGKLADDAIVFSVNFTVDCGDNIAYHFKTMFNKNTVVQNYKADGKWHKPAINDENTWTDGPGKKFVLTFHFDDNEMLVYSGDENRHFQYKFEYQFDIGDIKAVQVWDDVDYISEIIFRYGMEEWNMENQKQKIEPRKNQ